MSELSLTGKSISPKQQPVRSLSARSRSTVGDNRRANSVNIGQPNDAKLRRPKTGLAASFSKSSNSSSRRTTSGTRPSREYLSLFDPPPKNSRTYTPGSAHSSYSYMDSGRYNVRPERDRNTTEINRQSTNRGYHRLDSSSSKEVSISEPDNSLFAAVKDSSRGSAKQYASKKEKVTLNSRDVAVGYDYIPSQSSLDDREQSAVKIQKWYRRHSQRTKSSEAALKRMMQQKKAELETSINEEKQKSRQRTEEERRRQRREREREERRKAIAELRKSREVKAENHKSIVNEEMSMLADRRKKKKPLPKPTDQSDSVPSKAPDVSGSEAIKTVEEKLEMLFEETKTSTVERIDEKKSADSNDDESIPEDLPESATNTAQSGLLESLLETIQQLEAEPEQLTKIPYSSKFDEKLSWIEEMQSDHLSSVSNAKTRSVVSGAGDCVDSAKIDSHQDSGAILTKAKLSNLMDFLENVEKHDEEYEAEKSEVTKTSTKANTDVTESEKIAQLVEAEKMASNVTSELLKLRLDVDEKTKSVELLKKALQQQRELSLRQAQDHEKEMNQRLKMQKEQYEATIKRHLSFIDQLIDDKKVLNEKCERVVLEMKQAENKYQKKIKELQEAHAIEVKKQKEVLSAAEKLRREKWIEEKTRTIKEMTVKGLEPEIQRLIAKHKNEVKKLKAVHEAELLQSDERAGHRYIRQTEELREHLEREKEAACNREREMARQRYEKQLEQEEMALQQQRRRMYAEVADEKERINEQAARQRADIDKLKEQLQNQNSLATTALTDEYKKSKDEAERRHQAEIETLKERLELEKQAWQETYMKKQEAFILQKERELKDAVRRDRDTEIETVIEQLEKDTRVQREQMEKTGENRIKRIREKYESELKEIEILERQTQEKYNNLKVQYSDVEAENMRLKSTVTQKEQEIADEKKVKQKLVEERGNVTDIIREEFAERLVHTEEENKRMKNEIAQLRARQRLEIDRVNKEKEEELSEVHKRVRAAIVKKEEAIASIKEQYEAAVKRADHLEGLLETQRKQLLSVRK